MINNAFEEVINPPKTPDINNEHAGLLDRNWPMPDYITNLKCPYCKEALPKTSIRSISVKLNPRNIGDVCVEFLCKKCQVGNTLYFVKAVANTLDFIGFLNGWKKPSSEPIIEEEMYKQKYHNTLEEMIHKET